MPEFEILHLFQGIATLAASEPRILIGRVLLIFLGFLLIYLGKKGVLEALLMIPMGLGMAAVNAGVLFFQDGRMGTLFLDPLISETGALVNILQINWLQPIYTFTFSNGLIACLVLLGIGTLLDVGVVMQRPFRRHVPCDLRRGGDARHLPARRLARTTGEPSRGDVNHRRRRRPHGVVRLVDPGPRDLRPDHRRRLPVPGADLRGLSVHHQGDGAEIDPRDEHAVDRVRAISSEEKLVFAVVTYTAPAVPGRGPIGRRHPRAA